VVEWMLILYCAMVLGETGWAILRCGKTTQGVGRSDESIGVICLSSLARLIKVSETLPSLCTGTLKEHE